MGRSAEKSKEYKKKKRRAARRKKSFKVVRADDDRPSDNSNMSSGPLSDHLSPVIPFMAKKFPLVIATSAKLSFTSSSTATLRPITIGTRIQENKPLSSPSPVHFSVNTATQTSSQDAACACNSALYHVLPATRVPVRIQGRIMWLSTANN